MLVDTIYAQLLSLMNRSRPRVLTSCIEDLTSIIDMAVPNAKQQIPAVDVEREKMTRGYDGLLLSASDNHHNGALLSDKNGETTKL